MFKVRKVVMFLGLVLGIVGLSLPAQAQLKPVFTQNSVDGWFLGAEGRFTLFKFKLAKQELSLEPFLAAAYGLQSQAIRHKLGFSIGNFSLAHNDWPESAVLGRVGEVGTQVGLKLKKSQISGFVGELWRTEDEEHAPRVAYLSAKSSYLFSFPFDIELKLSLNSVIGSTLGANSGAFQYAIRTLSLRVGGLSVQAKHGMASKEADLKDFELTAPLKGYPEPLRGEEVWTLGVERRFDLISPIEVPIKLPMMAEEKETLVFKVEGSVFFEGGSAVAQDEEMGEILFGWGFGTIFSMAGLEMRAQLFFDKEGEFKPLFEMGGRL